MTRRNPHREDHTRYKQLLDATRDEEGVCSRTEAVKLFIEELATQDDRIAEYAQARANEVADGFDKAHQPEIENGQMALDIDVYLVIGKSERISIDDAAAKHTRQWLDVLHLNKARQDMAHATKTLHGYKLLAVQDEHKCSMWKAEQILTGGAS